MQKLKKRLTFQELSWVYETMGSLVDLMDERAVAEITSGTEKDLGKILNTIEDEAIQLLSGMPEPITSNKFYELDHLSKNIDESLKCLNYNYFKLTMLPDFYLAPHSIEWGNLVQLYQFLIILAARSLGKSFEMSMAYPIWKMYGYRRGTDQNPTDRKTDLRKVGALITNKYKLGKDLIKKISDEIKTNELLWDRLKPDSGGLGKEELECKNGAMLILRSYDSSIRGSHPGYGIVDDFLDKGCIYSQEQRDKFLDVFDAEIIPAIEPGGNVVVIGTPFHEADLYTIKRKDKKWKTFEYPAIFPDGRLAAPHRYNLESVMGLRQSLGSLIFSREILVVPISDSSTIFPWSILEKSFVGMQKYVLVDNIDSFPVKFKFVKMGCDFAISANIGSDSTVFTVWGCDVNDRWWLLHIWVGNGKSHNEQIAKVVELERKFRPNEIIMETNGFQQLMAEIAKEHGVRNIVEFKTNGFNKKDVYDGLPGLAVLFENGQILLPRGDEYSRKMTDYMCSEFNSITIKPDSGKLESAGAHDDSCMSAFFGIKGGTQGTKKQEFTFSMM